MSLNDFGKLRMFLWPIHRKELRQFVPMLLIFFLICFNYNLLRAAKDVIVVTAPQSGAETIPYLKVWAILPAAFLMTFFFTRLSNHCSRENLFYMLMGIFISFFLIFAFVLYPFRDSLHPHHFADFLQSHLPLGFKGFIALFRNWTFTLFYIMSEMWSTIIMTVLFWGFANEVTSVNDAKRFYGLFGVGANLSGIISGETCSIISAHKFNPLLPFGVDGWSQSVVLFCLLTVLFAGVSIVLFKWLHLKGLGYNAVENIPKESAPKFKMGMRKNFAYIAKSQYLLYIAIIVVAYNISINLVEVVWKDQVKALYPNPSDFSAYMARVQTATGVIATATSFFISSNVIRLFSWTKSALIPPVIILSTGIAFFSFLLLKNSFTFSIAAIFSSTPLALGVFFGSLQNCLARASKYTLFDSTKELAFVPLTLESKLKGKAAIDGVGSRLGKSGGSLVHQGLLMAFGTVAMSTPYVGAILFFSVGAWITAVKALGKRFQGIATQPVEEGAAKEPASSSPAQA